MIVSEVFGPTVQGEGPSLGRRCGFVRLGRCNLSCRWCDTAYTWDWDGRNGVVHDPAVELNERSVADLVDQVRAMGVSLVVVTGGEPLLQRRGITELCGELAAGGMDIEIETNATIAPWPALVASVSRFNASPKLANSGVPDRRRLVPAALAALVAAPTIFKFVVEGPACLDEIAALASDADIAADRIWVMAQGVTPAVIATTQRALADAVVARGWNVTTRLHVELWGDARGR